MRARRTGTPVLSGKSDRRVEKTARSLHHAFIGLVREKDYDRVAVREILDRAQVSRSTFYTHFEGKDDLLTSGIEQMLSTDATPESITSFGLPLFEHHDQHRRSGGMNAKTRRVLHERLRALVAERVREAMQHRTARRQGDAALPASLVAQHIASTFVLVLDWWLDSKSSLTPAQVNTLFCSLVEPALQSASAALHE